MKTRYFKDNNKYFNFINKNKLIKVFDIILMLVFIAFTVLLVINIIKLDNKVSDDLIVKVNGEKKFFARPGTIKDNVCVKITDVYDEMHELLRNYF